MGLKLYRYVFVIGCNSDTKYELQREKKYRLTCAPNVDLNQPAKSHSQ